MRPTVFFPKMDFSSDLTKKNTIQRHTHKKKTYTNNINQIWTFNTTKWKHELPQAVVYVYWYEWMTLRVLSKLCLCINFLELFIRILEKKNDVPIAHHKKIVVPSSNAHQINYRCVFVFHFQLKQKVRLFSQNIYYCSLRLEKR